MALQLHLPLQHYVPFRENEKLTAILYRERNRRSMLTAFFELNKVNEDARQYLYKDIPKHFTWIPDKTLWRPREGNNSTLVSIPGKKFFLPRIPLCPSENDMFPFKLKRKQFPVRLSFAMTINKAQGQTISNFGIYLPESVFSHGELYVGLSRGISRDKTKVLVILAKDFNQPGVYTSNLVYREVLHDA